MLQWEVFGKGWEGVAMCLNQKKEMMMCGVSSLTTVVVLEIGGVKV